MTAPDPKTVREIARKFLTDPDISADELGYVVRSYIGYVGGEEHTAWYDAVRADADDAEVVTIATWPDEQPQRTVLTPAELAELTASIEHLSGPDAWDENRLEPALIPVLAYMRRVLPALAETLQCGSHAHPDFVEDQTIRCELPDGHAWHRNGERTWTP